MAERVEVYRDSAREWRWRRIAVNEEPVSESGEGYDNLIHAVRMAKQLNPGLPVLEFDSEPLSREDSE